MEIEASKILLTLRRGKLWLNGLIIGSMNKSETLGTYWLRMINIDDSIIEGETEDACILQAKELVAIWLNDLLEDLT